VYGHLFRDEEDRTRRAIEEDFAERNEPSDESISDAE
jgi:hypothetical protein